MAKFNNGNTGDALGYETLKSVTLSVSMVKEWSNGLTFTLTVDRVSIYGCRIVSGKNGDFISFPARKGSDGKYYNHAYIDLTEEELNVVFGLVRRELNGN